MKVNLLLFFIKSIILNTLFFLTYQICGSLPIGGSILLEVYLFVNPLGGKCMSSEQNIIKLANELPDQLSYQFVPMLSMQLNDSPIGSNTVSLTDRNQTFAQHYQTVLDYKAALFQGKKRGRQFLLELQGALLKAGQQYSDSLVQGVAKTVNLDLEMFLEDRQSNLAKRAFKADQRLAAEMKVEHASTAVIYNALSDESGLRVDDVSYPVLREVCERQGFTPTSSIQTPTSSFDNHPHLRVL